MSFRRGRLAICGGANKTLAPADRTVVVAVRSSISINRLRRHHARSFCQELGHHRSPHGCPFYLSGADPREIGTRENCLVRGCIGCRGHLWTARVCLTFYSLFLQAKQREFPHFEGHRSTVSSFGLREGRRLYAKRKGVKCPPIEGCLARANSY